MDAAASNRGNAHDVVATYADIDAARAAITILERHGIEAGNIHLDVPGAERQPLSNDAQRDADMAATGKVGKRAGIGFVGGLLIGALVGAVLGAAASAIFDLYSPFALGLGGALAGGLFGAYAGGFYGGATGLPVSEAWGETYNAESSSSTGEPHLRVQNADGSRVDEVVQALRGTGALSLRRADGSGQMLDV
jgi:hypothetical protein